jgi:sodium transport system permease protein
MRWSIIRLIWLRDLRDQLRDRRTLFMIAVLPLVLYPLGGLGLSQLAFVQKTQTVGFYGVEQLPEGRAPAAGAWLATAPDGAPLGGLAGAASAASFAAAQLADPRQAFPPLFQDAGDGLRISADYSESKTRVPLVVVPLPYPGAADAAAAPTAPGHDLTEEEKNAFLAPFRKPVDDGTVDVVVVTFPDFLDRLAAGEKPTLHVLTRKDDEHSRTVNGRIHAAMAAWNKAIKDLRFIRYGLPADFDDAFAEDNAERDKPPEKRAAEDLLAMLVRVFPVVLVMWSLAGALYPAVDICAGEKERGTMETLLISPASREEIVYGKFLTIWVFSAATALLNLLSMGVTTWVFGQALLGNVFQPAALGWCVPLVLPLSAFFSAVALSVGAYARSSKEGQYYLMPLFLLTMPLIFLTLAPGVVLNAFYSMVPVTGVALLLQKLMSQQAADATPWMYFVPVLAPMVVYSWFALRWAVGQFKREEVLFREAERLDLGLWLGRLFREKAPLPTAGEAIFCFAVLAALHWLSFGLDGRSAPWARAAAEQLAFTAAPVLFTALLLTTRPLQSLGLRAPPAWAWAAAPLLALATLPPIGELLSLLREHWPQIPTTLSDQLNPLATKELAASATAGPAALLLLVFLPAICKELAFRGLILSGLRSRFRPWTAVFLSAFLAAAFQMNVFQFLPHFVFGVVLGVVVVRTGSVLPAMAFHLVYKAATLALVLWPETMQAWAEALGPSVGVRRTVAVVCALLGVVLIAALWRRGAAVKKAASGTPISAASVNGLVGGELATKNPI